MAKFSTRAIIFLFLLSSMRSVIKCEQRLLSEIVDKFNGASQSPPDPKVVQKYLLDMFGIRPSGRNRTGTPPSHMLDLYEYFVSKEDEEETSSRDRETDDAGMVIRSISPLPDYYRKNVLVFNISGLKSTEEVFTAQLHLRRRRLPRRHHKRTRKTLDPPMHVRLLRVWPFGSRRMSNIASYPVSSSEGGWRVVDVTAAVREDAATSSPNKLRFIGVRFEGPSHSDKRRSRSVATLNVEEFLISKCDPQNAAYLVIFSKQTDDIEDEDYTDAVDAEAHYAKEVYSTGKENAIEIMLPDSIRMTVEPRSPKYDEEESASRITNEIALNDRGSAFPGNWVGRQRSGRSLSDNELPGEESLGTYEEDASNAEEESESAIPSESDGIQAGGKDTEGEMIPYSDVYYGSKEPVNPIWWSSDWDDKSPKEEAEKKKKRGRKNDNGDGMKRFGEGKSGRKENSSPLRGGSRDKDSGLGEIGFGGGPRRKEARAGRKKVRGDICRSGMSAAESSDRRKILKGTVMSEEERSRKAFEGKWRTAKKGKMEDPWQSFGESIEEGKSRKLLKTKDKKLRLRKNDGRRDKEMQKDSGAVIGGDGLKNGVTCSILNFTIDTNKLGWSSWLYGPRVLHSSYCSGDCETEIIKDFSFRNHTKTGDVYDGARRRKEKKTTKDGRISSFISRSSFTRDKRSLSDVPKKTDKCCSPKLFAPLSVLYIDENEDIVLKSFPRMRVLRCGCA